MKQPKQAHATRPRALDARALAPVTGGSIQQPQPWLLRLENPEPSPW
jgi:hypothetical protein